MNDQPPPPPDDEPEIPPAPAWDDPQPPGTPPAAGAGSGSARRIGGLPVWAVGAVAAAVVIALVVVLVVALSGGGDSDPTGDAPPAVTAPDTVTEPATTRQQPDQLEDLPTDEDFAASVARPMDLLGGSATAVGTALAATSGPGDLARVNRVARRQGTVVTSARRQIGALPTPARTDHAQALAALTTATGHHRRYLDLLARSSAGTPSRAHLTVLSRARASAAKALTGYRQFFALAPGVPDTITSVGLADTAHVRSAIATSIAQREAARREAARREAERRRNEGRGDVIPDVDGFQSPTGNIRCEYRGSELFCSTSNDSFGVVLSESGSPVTGRGTAAGGATLSYGSIWSRGAFTCQSLTNGFTCENSSGNGFFLSRESYNSW